MAEEEGSVNAVQESTFKEIGGAEEEETAAISQTQRERIELNRKRAVELRKARIKSKPYDDANRSSITPRASLQQIDTHAGFIFDDPQEDEIVIKQPQTTHEEGTHTRIN